MATIKGRWLFNEELTQPTTWSSQAINWWSVSSTPANQGNKISIYSGTDNGYFQTYLRFDTNSGYFHPYCFTSGTFYGWSSGYKDYVVPIDFGTTEQEVSQEFYEWFTANAKPMVTDLTGYTITVPAGWNGSILDDLFYDVSGTVNGQSFIYIEGAGSDYINFLPMPDEDYLVMTPSSGFVVSFNGGTETDSEYLIQFFVENNATFEKTGVETQTLTVVNSNNPIETVTFTMPKGYTFEQFIGSAYDTSGGKFVISNKGIVKYESNKLLQEDTNNTYDTTVASGTFYYKAEAAQSGIWYNGSLLTTIKTGQTVTLHTNGKKAKTDIVIGWARLISFTIDGKTYQAENGMTWREWVDSAYNTDGFGSGGWNGLINSPKGDYIYDEVTQTFAGLEDKGPSTGHQEVHLTIIPNATYVTKSLDHSGGIN